METTQNTQIQYQNTQETSLATIQHYDDIEFYRRSLFQTQILSFSDDTTPSYGNMSKRTKGLEFVITASKTGDIPELLTKHYVHIKSAHPTNNIVETIGFADSSRDVFIHYYIYETRPDITHIFHGYHIDLWEHLLKNDYPFISKDITPGSQEFIEAIKELISKDKDATQGIFALEGYKGGFISYADDGRKASRQIKKILKQFPDPVQADETVSTDEVVDEELSTQRGES